MVTAELAHGYVDFPTATHLHEYIVRNGMKKIGRIAFSDQQVNEEDLRIAVYASDTIDVFGCDITAKDVFTRVFHAEQCTMPERFTVHAHALTIRDCIVNRGVISFFGISLTLGVDQGLRVIGSYNELTIEE